ncbi:basement membrane-specific heparan sulfate proteoglycan core protein-like isoform X3 [Esox lucius]|uniref:basement membrane-specific heparan sulfate proteoglycan core protein-like isoform X3 n=1 Tax=Esox lucius TaxID=8010 RepID=UPI0010BD9113|nr:basement membrane-specific heparan sulfate proteoglycan core protein-like isoform X3 [Esox lucius]
MDHTGLCVLLSLPTASVIVYPYSLFYPGETVTLQCDIPGYTDWTYHWYQNNQLHPSLTSKIITFTITLTGPDGLFSCEGTRTDRPQWSQRSAPFAISVTALPTASVIVYPYSPFYPGETVTLQCDIPGYTDWTYHWYQNNQLHPSLTSKIITFTITLTGPDGLFSCEGTRTDRPQWSQRSAPFAISVTGNRPTAKLSSDQNAVFTGDSVTLSCTVESSGWTFYWYRISQVSQPVFTSSVFSYTLSQVTVSDGGQYWCRAGKGNPVYYTLYSKPVQIQVTERPVAVLTLQPNWPQIFIGETVTLRCVIQGGDINWQYTFYSNSNIMYNTNPVYRISAEYTSQSGQYTCVGVKGNTRSETSQSVQLTVSYKPKAVLSISPQWLNPGDSVNLSCKVKVSSAGWRFFWYKMFPYRAGSPSLLDMSYSVELLSENGTEESYNMSPAGSADTGGYVCRAGRGDPVYYTDYSKPQFLWSGELQASVSLKINLSRTQQFLWKTLSLSCELKGNTTGWRLMRNTETGVESGCPSYQGSITGTTCTRRSIYTGDSGVYWCESGSGEYSNAVNITVHAGDVILESPVHPVSEGESVTLRCLYKHQGTNPNNKADFYKDRVLISSETTGEMTIPEVSKSDEGFYKCTSDQGESRESWVTVRSVPPGYFTSVLVGVIVGMGVAGALLVILLVLLCRYQNSKGSCCHRVFWPIHLQSTNQDPQQDQGSTQVQSPDSGYTGQQYGQSPDAGYTVFCPTDAANIYCMICHSDNDNDAAGASAGPGDVTYAQVQLKMLNKKNKEKSASLKEDSVYSEVNTGKATAAAGLVDVTYAEIYLRNKLKIKKKKGSRTQPEPESVYSQVKPDTA